MVTFNGSLHFCSNKCLDDYRKRLQQKVRKRKFQLGYKRRGSL